MPVVVSLHSLQHRTSKRTDLFADHMGGGYQGSLMGQENPQYRRETLRVSNMCNGNLESRILDSPVLEDNENHLVLSRGTEQNPF